MKRYPSYKDSGVEWIGEIPEHWELSKWGYFFQSGMGQTILKEDLDEDGDIPVYSATEEDRIFGFINNPNIILESGDIIIPARGNSIGHVKLVQGKSTTTQTTIYSKPYNLKILSTYTYYYCKGNKSNLFPFVQTAIPQITVNEISSNPIILPPLSEQTQIVSYLDRKTEGIDKLIQTKIRKIELLKEYRTSLISKVVTKGLNPNVKMKDSGVEWIGEIPEHWTTPKLSFYCEVKDGTHSTPTYVDEGYPLVTQKDITKGKLDFSKTKNISKEDYDEINKRSNVVYGDIIMSMIGSIGNPTIVDTETPFSIKNVCLFKTSESNERTNFIHYFLNSSVLMTELELKSRGGVQGFVSLDVLRNITFIKPPLSEQTQIVSYLDEQTQLIDKNIQTEEKKIELLKEYRQSLISEVVTGKIKVSNDEEVH